MPRFARTVSACLLLGLPFAFVAQRGAALVEPCSQAVVAALLRLSAPLQGQADVPQAPVFEDEQAVEVAAQIPAATKPGKGRVVSSRPATPPAVFVSAATVLRLSQGSARPAGAFVAATAQHPAGLRLSGVAALGIGVQDGDILVEALGVPPRSPGQIIGAIIEARAKQARYLGGTVWRRGQTFRITVEQPYLPAPAAQASTAPLAGDGESS